MPILRPLLFALLLPTLAHADAHVVGSVEAGVFESRYPEQQPGERVLIARVQPIQKTDQVPLKIGTKFGLRYRLEGKRADDTPLTLFERITGYSGDEVRGLWPTALSADRQQANRMTFVRDQILRVGKWEGELWLKRKDGDTYPCWIGITAVRDAEDDLVSYVCTLRPASSTPAASDTTVTKWCKSSSRTRPRMSWLSNSPKPMSWSQVSGTSLCSRGIANWRSSDSKSVDAPVSALDTQRFHGLPACAEAFEHQCRNR